MSVAGASGGDGGGGFGGGGFGGGGSWGGGGGGGDGGDDRRKKRFMDKKEGLNKIQSKELAEGSSDESNSKKASADDLLAGAKAVAAEAQSFADEMSQLEPEVAGGQPGVSRWAREAQQLAAVVAAMHSVLETGQTLSDDSPEAELVKQFKDLSTK